MTARYPWRKRDSRQSIRLPGYDYTGRGTYFVTLVTHRRSRICGIEIKGEVRLSRIGTIMREEWMRTPTLRPLVRVYLDETAIMPDHMHGIIHIDGCSPHEVDRTQEGFGRPIPGSLPTIIRAFKAMVTRRVRQERLLARGPVWHRNYYEHVIRDTDAYARIHRYIAAHPRMVP